MVSEQYTFTERSFPVTAELAISYRHYLPAAPTGRTPLLYLPGFMRTARDFDRVAKLLAAEREIIAVDTRGRGGATRAASADDYRFELLVDDAWKLLDALGVDRVVVAGLALGVFMAWQMASEQPRRIAGIIANDSGTETSSPSGKAMALNARHAPCFFEEAVSALRGPNAQYFADFDDQDWIDYTHQVYTPDADGLYVRDFDYLVLDELARFKAERASFWDAFAGLGDIPVLIVNGAMSTYLAQEHAERMAAQLPRAKLIRLAERGHPALLDEPASMTAIRQMLGEADNQPRPHATLDRK